MEFAYHIGFMYISEHISAQLFLIIIYALH